MVSGKLHIIPIEIDGTFSGAIIGSVGCAIHRGPQFFGGPDSRDLLYDIIDISTIICSIQILLF